MMGGESDIIHCRNTMTKEERLIEMIHGQPFKPFEIRTSDGGAYEVDHPDFVARSRDTRTVVYFTGDDRMVMIDTAQIVSLEVANRPAA
jgi:hypothetical protein